MNEKYISALTKGHLSIKCPHMEIKRDDQSNLIEIVGEIYTEDGEIHFSGSKKNSNNESPFQTPPLLQHKNKKAGEFLKEDEYIYLVAKNPMGQEYRADIKTMTVNSGFDGSTFKGTLGEISLYEIGYPTNEKIHINYAFKTNLDLPLNKLVVIKKFIANRKVSSSTSLKASEINVSDLELFYEEHDEHSTISISLNKTSYERIFNIDLFFSSLFGLIKGGPVDFFYKETTLDNVTQTIFSHPEDSSKSTYKFIPTGNHQFYDANNVTELINAYYEFSLNSKEDKQREISRHIRNVLIHQDSILEVSALTLSVAIEGLLQDFLSDPTLQKETENEVEKIKEQINKIEINSKLKDRLNGFLNTTKKQSASDILYGLQMQSAIEEEKIKSWKALRHKLAHGGSIKQKESQKNYLHLGGLHTLFFNLLSIIIKYKGHYIDHGVLGWPVKHQKNLDTRVT